MDRAFAGAASAKSDRDNFEQECAVVNFPKNPVLRNAQAIYSRRCDSKCHSIFQSFLLQRIG